MGQDKGSPELAIEQNKYEFKLYKNANNGSPSAVCKQTLNSLKNNLLSKLCQFYVNKV